MLLNTNQYNAAVAAFQADRNLNLQSCQASSCVSPCLPPFVSFVGHHVYIIAVKYSCRMLGEGSLQIVLIDSVYLVVVVVVNCKNDQQ